MNQNDLIEIFKVLGASSIAFIILFIIRELNAMLKNKVGTQSYTDEIQRIESLEHIVSNEYRHEFDNIWIEIREIRNDLDELKKEVNSEIKAIGERLTKLEIKKQKRK